MCRNYMLLESGNPVNIKLQPGICEISDENDVTFSPFDTENPKRVDSTSISSVYTNDNRNRVDDIDKIREKKNVINLGTNYKITKNKTFAYTEKVTNLPWQPILESGNSLEKNLAESSRSFPAYMPGEIYEPILKDRQRPKVHTGRSFNVKNDPKPNVFNEEEIMEPILKATTARSRKTKQVSLDNGTDPHDNSSYFNVQLLPFRLGEFFEKAERYARETLLPLISEQAPRFFGFGIDRDDPNQRRPKYIPKIGEIRNETVRRERRIDLPPFLNDTSFTVDNPIDEFDSEFTEPINTTAVNLVESSSEAIKNTLSNESRGTKNILSLLRTREKRTSSPSSTSRSIEKPLIDLMAQSRAFKASHSYYTNPDAIETDDNLKVVRIDLPTYKPFKIDLPTFKPPPISPLPPPLSLSHQQPKLKPSPQKYFPYQFVIPSDPL